MANVRPSRRRLQHLSAVISAVPTVFPGPEPAAPRFRAGTANGLGVTVEQDPVVKCVLSASFKCAFWCGCESTALPHGADWRGKRRGVVPSCRAEEGCREGGRLRDGSPLAADHQSPTPCQQDDTSEQSLKAPDRWVCCETRQCVCTDPQMAAWCVNPMRCSAGHVQTSDARGAD